MVLPQKSNESLLCSFYFLELSMSHYFLSVPFLKAAEVLSVTCFKLGIWITRIVGGFGKVEIRRSATNFRSVVEQECCLKVVNFQTLVKYSSEKTYCESVSTFWLELFPALI